MDISIHDNNYAQNLLLFLLFISIYYLLLF